MAILRKLPAAVAVAALTVTLYGCGGSSRIDDLDEEFGGSVTAEDLAALKKGEADAKAAAAAAVAAQMDAEEKKEAAEMAATVAAAAQKVADDAAAAAKTAAETSAADAAVKAQEAIDAQKDADAAVLRAKKAEADQIAAQTLAAAETMRADNAKQALQDLMDANAQASRIDTGKLLEPAIRAATIGTIGGATDPNDRPSPVAADEPAGDVEPFKRNFGAARGTDGMVTISANPEAQYATYSSDGAEAADVWTEVVLTRSNVQGTSAEEMHVYTDIVAPTDTKLKLNGGGFVSEDGTKEETFGLSAAGASTALNSLISIDIAPTATEDVSYDNIPKNDTSGTFQGTYRGIRGTFTCAAKDCTFRLVHGKLTATGHANFSPTDDDDTYPASDARYTWFGWWLDKGASAFSVEVFSGGTAESYPTDIEPVIGQASYEGTAAGKYIAKSYTAGAQQDADLGHFTADMALHANFGSAKAATTTDGESVGTRPYGIVTGAVTNFELLGMPGGTSTAGWTVTLGLGLDESHNVDKFGAFGGATSVSFGGPTKTGAGTWSGQFYDPSKDASGARDDGVPGTAVGTFKAIASGASVAGAFGAKKK